jgi:thiamine-phosphate pyrophosphorylase
VDPPPHVPLPQRISLTGLYVILDAERAGRRSLQDTLTQAAAGGARIFQYRNKRASMMEAYREARPLRACAAEAGALFIVNDRCDLALAVEADGVHLGQEDLPLADARRIMGPRLIGISTHRPEQVRKASADGADYVAFGPIFRTASKSDHEPVVGIEGLREARRLTTLPLFAIGGITVKDASELRDAGADGVAVISAILQATDVSSAVKTFLQSW